jgi:hypothetical protein
MLLRISLSISRWYCSLCSGITDFSERLYNRVLTPKRPEKMHKRETLDERGEFSAVQPIIPEKIKRINDQIKDFKSRLRR